MIKQSEMTDERRPPLQMPDYLLLRGASQCRMAPASSLPRPHRRLGMPHLFHLPPHTLGVAIPCGSNVHTESTAKHFDYQNMQSGEGRIARETRELSPHGALCLALERFLRRKYQEGWRTVPRMAHRNAFQCSTVPRMNALHLNAFSDVNIKKDANNTNCAHTSAASPPLRTAASPREFPPPPCQISCQL